MTATIFLFCSGVGLCIPITSDHCFLVCSPRLHIQVCPKPSGNSTSTCWSPRQRQGVCGFSAMDRLLWSQHVPGTSFGSHIKDYVCQHWSRDAHQRERSVASFSDSRNSHYDWYVILTLSLSDVINNSPYCLPSFSYDISSENLVLDQLIVLHLIFVVILITFLLDILLLL